MGNEWWRLVQGMSVCVSVYLCSADFNTSRPRSKIVKAIQFNGSSYKLQIDDTDDNGDDSFLQQIFPDSAGQFSKFHGSLRQISTHGN